MMAQASNLGDQYIAAWKTFHPSKAANQGLHEAIFLYEDRSHSNIQDWIRLNKKFQIQLSNSKSDYVRNFPIDSRLLKIQVQAELDKWETLAQQEKNLGMYTSLLGNAISSIFNARYLDVQDQNRLICDRLSAMITLCESAQQNLKTGSRTELSRALNRLAANRANLQNTLSTQMETLGMQATCSDFSERIDKTLKAMEALGNFVEQELLPKAQSTEPILGREEYARRLALYTDSPLSPETLSEIAVEEIRIVRQLMGEVSTNYLKKTYPQRALPDALEERVSLALADMEKDAPLDGADYLSFWQDLATQAVDFIKEKEIATLPEFQTLRIMTAPESAGPAARIGWVDAAPPFDPNPVTTLYLPSIPDTFPQQERIDFWSSFNKPFNRMIVIHELYPGHYMQIKISRETAHPVRLLFPYAPYFEGWATFTERVLLDAGWEKERQLTFLAHLRKRIENANRAYTSVQVHCYGWTAEQVLEFSTETSLLAPQFAKSLWGRIMRSPMQLTSYFWGGQQFTQLLATEKERLGDQFVLKDFMDMIMRAGAIPIDDFPELLKAKSSK